MIITGIIFLIMMILIAIYYIRREKAFGDTVKRTKISTQIIGIGTYGSILIIAGVIIETIIKN